MPVFISLIRGINVGGNKLIKMDALKALYAELGLKEVRSHLQSGNVVFAVEGKASADKLAERIAAAIEENVGFRPAVMLRTPAELATIIADNPFKGEAESDPGRVAVMFLAGRANKDAEARIAAVNRGPEAVRVAGKDVYLHYPDGMGRSKLTNAILEKQLGVAGTARNWNTVTRLLRIAEPVRS